MRILLISDLHANWPALEAVLAAEPFDRLVVVGDLVSYGPHPREVVQFVRERASVAVRGNHDEALSHDVDCRCAPASKPLAEATQAVHRALLSAEDVRFLGGLPLTASFAAEGARFLVVHASPRDQLYRYTLTPSAPDEHLRDEFHEVPAGHVVLGHTHLPMIRRVDGWTAINPGSVGQPRDGDPRASYAVIEDGAPRLGRIAYDLDRAVDDLRGLRLDPPVTDRLISILRNGAG